MLSRIMVSSCLMAPMLCSTGDAAKAVGITRATLQAWIANGKIVAPKAQDLGKLRVRLWTESDLNQLRRAKLKIYKKQVGRPKKKL